MSHERSERTVPLKAVYAYYFPEVRAVIDKIAANYPHETFLKSVEPGLDDFHIPVIESYLKHFENQLPDLKNFRYRYVLGGASEGIFHFLAKIATSADKKNLYILEGEYEGYSGYGANLGLHFETVKEIEDLKNFEPGIIFISNPSARDGNIIDNKDILAACEVGHKVIYDATYVGLTDPYRFEVGHENIIAVLTSLSKPFGLYYYRVGFAFSTIEMKTLEANKWFKNILSLTIAKDVLDTIGETELVKRYRSYQKEALDEVERSLGFRADPSEVILLGSAKSGAIPPGWEDYSRKHNYRFCLTPYFLNQERGKV